MDIMELGAIGELVGGVAVIATLVYLAMQVRQSNRQESAQALKECITEFVAAFAEVTSTETAAENFRAGIDHFDEMTANQQSVFHSKMQMLGNGYYQVWTLRRLMLLPEEDFLQARNLFLAIVRTRGGQQWWNAWKHIPPKPFIVDLEQALGERANDELLPWFRYEKPA